MATINELFSNPKPYDHPRLRSWLSWKKKATTTKSYIEFRRERDGLTFNPATIFFTAEQGDEPEHCDSERWDVPLNDALVERGFKACSPENEAERFGYMLVSRLQPIVIKFGDGFFNSVLIPYLKKNRYHERHVQLAEILDNLKTYEPAGSVQDCEDLIEGVLAKCAIEIKEKLGYSVDDGRDILLGALIYYLDERFNITNRRLLGW